MKMPIDWHRTNLENSKSTLRREEHALLALMERVANLRARVDHAERQVAEAERRGLDSYDAERFLNNTAAKRKSIPMLANLKRRAPRRVGP